PTRRYPAYERFALRVKRSETRSRLGIGSGSAGFEGLLQLFHEELVDAAGDHLQELLAVRDLVAAAGVVAAAAGALGGVDAVRARRALAVRQLEVRRGAAQVERLHRRRRPVRMLRVQRLGLRRPDVEVLAAFLQD